MAKISRFGALLQKVRREQGFPTAYAFYHGRDGRKIFGLSYRNYLFLEQGKFLPKAERVEPILRALGLGEQSPSARDLVECYFESTGVDKLARFLGLGGAPADAADPRKLLEEATRQTLTQRTVQLGLDQWAALARDAAAYSCHTFLVNTPGWVAIEDLGKLTGLGAAGVKRTLKSLAAAKVVEISKDRVRSPFARQHLRLPAELPAASGLKSAMYRYREGWTSGRAKLSGMHWLTVRMDKKNLERYMHQLTEAVNLSAVYGDVEKTENTAVFLVEGRVYDLFP